MNMVFRFTCTVTFFILLNFSYLVHGNNIKKSSWFFRIGRFTMYKLVPEVCKAIHTALKNEYLSFSRNIKDWETIVENFKNLWHMPNCLGAVDGKIIRLKAPPNSGSKFYNYKKFFSFVLMAMCDAFQRVNIGDYGNIN